MPRNITHQWFFQHSPEHVWDCLTKSDLLSQWLMENNFRPVVGHKFRFDAKPRVKIGFDGIVYCEVLEVVPFKRLVYSWKGGPGNGKIALDSVVTWTLTQKNNGTELLLVHSGFKTFKNLIAYLVMNKGWGGKIKERLTGLLNKVVK